MALLDRFRTQTRHAHQDPAVRLAYVEELPLDERDLLAAMARDDPDPRVRRAAVAKLLDPAPLAVVAGEDADETVRGRAVEMLRDIALEAYEGVSEAESLAAVTAVADPKTLGHIAKAASREDVARSAVARVTDSRMLGSIARHAVVEPVRRMALGALHDRDEIVAVAMNGEFKDAAVAAVERLTERGDLEAVATRGKNKAAAKRARALVREMDGRAAEAAVATEPAPPDASEVARSERQQIVRRLEALQTADDPHAAENALVLAEAAWASVEGVADPALVFRFTTVSALARARIGERRTRLFERERATEEAVRLSAARAALCDQVDQLGGPTTLDELVRLREEWRRLSPLADAAAMAAHDRRFEQAARACERRYTEWKEAERRRARCGELVAELEAAVEAADFGAARRRVVVVHHEWKDLASGMAIEPEFVARLEAGEARLAAREAEAREQDARARRDVLNRVQHLVGRVEPLVARTDVSLKALERALRDVRSALGDLPPLPSKADYDEATGRLKAVQAALTPRVQELRKSEDWQRWANVGVQEQLCERMEALRALEDPEEIARQIRELQQQWRQVADVPRAQGEALWRRLKAAHDEAWARCEAHFAAEAVARAENLARKIALCERVEALADSTSWIRTAEAIKQLQAEWKTIGLVSRGQEKMIWERFRTACDRFFTRRHEDLARLKATWAENLAKKEALCVQAEGVAESSDWEVAAADIRRLQAEWKTIGPVKKSRSDPIWSRFRAACDRFFSRYAQRHNVARAERVAAREAICAELERLALPEAAGSEPPADLVAKVRAIRARWQQELAARGVEREQALALDQRFASAFAHVVAQWSSAFDGTDLDPDANQRRMETLCRHVEELATSLGDAMSPADQALSPTTRLAAMLKEALAANTIGGKVDEESRWRAAAEDVRQAQASWTGIGPVSDAVRHALGDRFQRACRRILERAESRSAAPAGVARPGGAGSAGRAGGTGR
jgi:hypothetical protein